MFCSPELKGFCILTASLPTLGSKTPVELQQQGKHRLARERSARSWNRGFQLALGGPGVAWKWFGVRRTPFSLSYSCVGLAHILI